MRRWVAAIGIACGLAGPAAAQSAVGGLGTAPSSLPAAMPGREVGSSFNLKPSGTALPKAAPQAGAPVGGPLSRPYDPARPLDALKGTGIDPKNVVAPPSPFVPAAAPRPDLATRIYEKLVTMVGLNPEAPPPPANVTPGIFRRNRERARERMWRAD